MSRIKECFISRFEGGSLIQFDYSQLEVVCLAFLSRDENLKNDLLSGIDMHCRAASFLTGKTYVGIKAAYDFGVPWAHEARQKGKTLGFLVQYGGAAGLMSQQTGLPKADCAKFIKAYYDRYSGVKTWQRAVAAAVAAGAKPSTTMVAGVQAKKSVITSVTGRRYTFVEQKAPGWAKGHLMFSPTQMKNFKVQGFATGDIVPMMLGKVNRLIHNTGIGDAVKLVNTTHDSLMLDTNESINKAVLIGAVIMEMEKAPAYLNEIFGIDFDMKLPVEAEIGPNWGALKKWTKVRGEWGV